MSKDDEEIQKEQGFRQETLEAWARIQAQKSLWRLYHDPRIVIPLDDLGEDTREGTWDDLDLKVDR